MNIYDKIRCLFDDDKTFELSCLDEEYSIIYHNTENYTKQINNHVELFEILLHEFTYNFLECNQVEEIEELAEANKNTYFKRLESFKQRYFEITNENYIEVKRKGFGNLIKQIRQRKNMMKAQVAADFCNVRTLSRIENNDIPCSAYFLFALSNALETNLYMQYTDFSLSNSVDAYLVIEELKDAISIKNVEEIRKIEKKMAEMPDFQSGINFQYLCYARILLADIATEYNSFLTYSESALCAVHKDFSLENLDNFKAKSYLDYVLLNCLATYYLYNEKLETSEMIYKKIIDLRKLNGNSTSKKEYAEDEKELYQRVFLNLAAIYYRKKDYETALVCINKAITYAYAVKSHVYLSVLHQKKFCILCRLHRWEDAQEAYYYSYYNAVLSNAEKDERLLKTLQEDYDELFKKV